MYNFASAVFFRNSRLYCKNWLYIYDSKYCPSLATTLIKSLIPCYCLCFSLCFWLNMRSYQILTVMNVKLTKNETWTSKIEPQAFMLHAHMHISGSERINNGTNHRREMLSISLFLFSLRGIILSLE